MRLSTHQTFMRGLNGILNGQAEMAKTQQSISSGKKIQTPADDPVAATRILRIRQELSLNEQYRNNINAVQNRLELEEITLDGIENVIQRVRELVVQAGNGVLDEDSRSFIAEEVKVRLQEAIDLMNSKDASDDYIFSGFQSKQPPFVQRQDGSWQFQGDEGQRFLQIAVTTTLASNDSGKGIFVDIPSAENTFDTSENPNNASLADTWISSGRMVDQAQFDAFYPEDAIIEFRPLAESLPPGQANFTVKQKSDGQVIAGLQNVTFVSGQTITFNGIEVAITGNPQVGDTFFVESGNQQSLPETLERLIDGLENFKDNSAGNTQLRQLLDESLANLDNAHTSILETRARIGARLNTAESTLALNEDFTFASTQVLSDIEDTDYAEAISNLTFQEFVLQAAQQSFTKVSGLTLFNFLR